MTTLTTELQRTQQLNKLCEIIGLLTQDVDLINQALTHSSFAYEHKSAGIIHNERLEFLGDAVLELVVTNHLYRLFPSASEGELTKYRAAIVCEETLSKAALRLHLGLYLRLGKGEDATGGRNRPSILADAMESLIGAIYVIDGITTATSFVTSQLKHEFVLLQSGELSLDHKTQLQEVVQKKPDQKIEYRIISETGPDHSKRFQAIVKINGNTAGSGYGRTKKEAEQSAARMAFDHYC